MMTTKQIREKIQFYLNKGEIEESINFLIYALNNSQNRRFYDEAFLLKANWEMVKRERLRGILTKQEYDLSRNNIIIGIQTIINEIDEKPIEYLSTKGQKAHVLKHIVLASTLLIVLIGGYFLFNYIKRNSVENALPDEYSKTQTSPGVLEADKRMIPIRSTSENSIKDSLLTKPLTTNIESQSSKNSIESMPVNNSSKSESIFYNIKIIVSNIDVGLKINNKVPEYIGTHTGIVRTIRVTKGSYKFEVIENGFSCILVKEIKPTTKKIYLNCK